MITVLVDLGPAQRRRLDRSAIPYVVVDPVATPDESVYSIGATNFAGGRSATEHLLGLGHRKIGVLAGPSDVLCAQARVAGYRAAMEQAGAEVRAGYVRYGHDFGIQSGRTESASFLDLDDPATALFVCVDTLVLGAYRAVGERGLRVPDDLSIVGFDDRPESHWVSPRLTTIRQPVESLAGAECRVVAAFASC